MQYGQYEFSQLAGPAGQCANCGRHAKTVTGGRLLSCSVCHAVYYCGKECQKIHWKVGHKRACKASLEGLGALSSTASEASSQVNRTPASKAPTATEDDETFVMNGDCPLVAAAPWSMQAHVQAVMKKSLVCQLAWRHLHVVDIFKTLFQAALATSNMSWPASAQIDRKDLVQGILKQLEPLLTLFYRHCESCAWKYAEVARQSHSKGTLVLESHGKHLESLIGPGALDGSRCVAVHYMTPAALSMYFSGICKDMKVSRSGLEGACNHSLFAEDDVVPVLAAFSHSQGGFIHGKRPGFAQPGGTCLAHTSFGLRAPEDEKQVQTMEGLLNLAGLQAAQAIQVDLSNGEVVAVDFDQSKFTTFVSRCGAGSSETDLPLDPRQCPSTQVPAGFSKVNSDTEKIKEGHDRALDAMRAGMPKQADAMADLRRRLPPPEPGAEPSPAFSAMYKEFIIQCLPLLASFAAAHHHEYGRGALFLLSRSSWKDLLVSGEVAKRRCLDRQLLLIWGTAGGKAKGRKKSSCSSMHRSPATADHLRARCRDWTVSLNANIERACDCKSFTLVLIADPSGERLPVEQEAVLRPPGPGNSTDALVNVAVTLYIDYDEMLASGRQSGFHTMDVFTMNLDRDDGDPLD